MLPRRARHVPGARGRKRRGSERRGAGPPRRTAREPARGRARPATGAAAGSRRRATRSGPLAQRDGRTTARSAGRAGSLAELAVVLGLVVVAERRGDEAVRADRPLLEAGDAHRLAGLGARAGERPVILDAVVLEDELVHRDLDVRKGGNERLGDLGDRRRLAAVDRDRRAGGVVGGDASGIAAAPRLRVAACELLDLPPVVRHRLPATLYAGSHKDRALGGGGRVSAGPVAARGGGNLEPVRAGREAAARPGRARDAGGGDGVAAGRRGRRSPDRVARCVTDRAPGDVDRG